MQMFRRSLGMRVLRAVVTTLLAVGFVAAATPAAANSKYAALVIHARTGDILFDRYSTEHRYPASLTKMMTLYLLFEAIEEGKYDLDSKLSVSRNAAAQPPSKLGVRAGGSIEVEKAIEALAIKSANDVAVVVAEALGGSESRVAPEMTRKARSFGMHSTTFRNASGLPNSRQKTTARDLAILSQRISQDFPEHFHYFAQKSFDYGGRTYRTHNRIVTSYEGADGLKTGYTRLSGFNLSATAKRGDDRLIGIVLGGRTSVTRDNHMKEILDAAFDVIEKKPLLISAVHRATPTPRMKPTQAEILAIAKAEAAGASAPEPLRAEIVAVAKTFAVPVRAADAPKPDAEDAIGSLITTVDGVKQPGARYAAAEALAPETGEGDIDPEKLPEAPRTWAVQIGAYSTPELAAKELTAAVKGARDPLVATASQAVYPSSKDGQTLYRARFVDLNDEDAETICLTLKRIKRDCLKLLDS